MNDVGHGEHAPPHVSFVELVLVHGIGRQRPRETLLRWAEPLVRRIDWLAGDEASARLVAVDLDVDLDPRVVVATQVADDSGAERLVEVTITEARWAEAFPGIGRGETFVWGLSFLRRTIARLGGFIARLLVQMMLDVVALPAWAAARTPVPRAVWTILLLPLSVATAVATLAALVILGLALAALLLAGYAALILVGPVLLIPGVSRVLGPIVELVVEFIGDAAAWTRRPVRAAAMRRVVAEALDEAEGRLERAVAANGGEGRLVVLGHSQGASIAADVLFNRPDGRRPPRVDSLITVGAAVTLLGRARWSGAAQDLPAMENPVVGWSRHEPPVRWSNFWGVFDPFPSGPISTTAVNRLHRWRESFERTTPRRSAPGPEERPVLNTGWPFTEHLAYAGNIPQVVDPVARLLLDLPTPAADPHASLRRIRHSRGVRALGLQRMLVLALSATVLMAGPPLLGPVEWTPPALTDLLGENAAWIVAAVALAVLGLWINEALWRQHAARIAWRRVPRPPRLWLGGLVYRAILLAMLTTSAALSWRGAAPGLLAGAVSLVLLVAPHVGRLPRVAPARRVTPRQPARRD
ncbi:hypothetical protein FVA74_07405 [Salinibacterium sp. dk2585]|uniref:hypothetical protein n=1 Tax=unclassified Salinibacterium TaxID=2632331 RepID=UPI0011C24A14|nr:MULTISPECIES: hypothetical protein [unclassified Salinibacterium]QEE61422.1 hypothetical protein FVA74_07405 [Salinibacterium sp. dk2585]TXK54099.1 hypothetical protein FVP63_08855 [Salinibacterium sp. dk5596]